MLSFQNFSGFKIKKRRLNVSCDGIPYLRFKKVLNQSFFCLSKILNINPLLCSTGSSANCNDQNIVCTLLKNYSFFNISNITSFEEELKTGPTLARTNNRSSYLSNISKASLIFLSPEKSAALVAIFVSKSK